MGADGRRVSHDDLMAGQELLGRARDAEQAAGNAAVAALLNGMVVTLFKVAIQVDIDSEIEAVMRRG
jgi:hypothetical protein